MNDFRRSNSSRGGDRHGGYPRRDYGPRSYGGNRDHGRREMFQATCAECGNRCEVPFQPRDDRPVYCSNCFEKRGNSNTGSRNFDRPQMHRQPGDNGGQNSDLGRRLNEINGKLDQLLNLLSPIAREEEAKKTGTDNSGEGTFILEEVQKVASTTEKPQKKPSVKKKKDKLQEI